MDWTDRLDRLQGHVTRSIEGTAADGHRIRGDLLAPQPGAKGPLVMVTCEPIRFDDGSPDLERFPSFMEQAEAADELLPLAMLATMLPTFPPGQREPPPPGARTIPWEYVGRFVPPGGIEVVGSIGA